MLTNLDSLRCAIKLNEPIGLGDSGFGLHSLTIQCILCPYPVSAPDWESREGLSALKVLSCHDFELEAFKKKTRTNQISIFCIPYSNLLNSKYG